MPKELIEEGFNKELWRMNSIEVVNHALEEKLRIFYEEGIINGQNYVIEKLKPHMNFLGDILK